MTTGILNMLLELANNACRAEIDMSRHIPGQPVPGKITPPLYLAVDIETRQHHITCIGIAWNKREALCIPFTCEEDTHGYWSLEEEAQIVYRLYQLLTHPGVRVIGQNWIYDSQHILRWWNFIPRFAFDTMLAQHVMFPIGGSDNEDKDLDLKKKKNTSKTKSLDFLASLYCEHYCQWKGEARELWKEAE